MVGFQLAQLLSYGVMGALTSVLGWKLNILFALITVTQDIQPMKFIRQKIIIWAFSREKVEIDSNS